MNNTEKAMVDILKNLRDNYCVTGVKAEFEAEGTRLDEALRLKEIVMKSELGLTIKIGGCEAIKDMYECRTIGVDRVVAPMIESAYALKKYIMATKIAFTDEEREDIKFSANIETILGVSNFDEMLSIPEVEFLDGIVMGRVDLTGSMGLSRNDINSYEVFNITKELFTKSKKRGMENAVGGGVSAYSIPFIKELQPDRFETRKVIFKCPEALEKDTEKGILKAVEFEVLWLRNKKEYYRSASLEDYTRLKMLEDRYLK